MSLRFYKFLFSAFIIGVLVGYFLKSPTAFIEQSGIFPSPTKVYITSTVNPDAETAKVKKVIDGDTVDLEDGRRVRYTGMDTPEISHKNSQAECFANEAMKENKKLVEGKEVILKKDISDKDKYGRFLRYVFLKENESSAEGLFINNYLVKEGYANILTIPPDVAYSSLLKDSQKLARIDKKGLWGKCKTP